MKTDLGSMDMQALENLDPAVMETMLWHGLVSGHKHEDKELKLTRDDMEDVLDECMFDFIKIIPLFFPQANVGNVVPDLKSPQKEEEQPG